jgi:hypothetical protein
MLAGSPGRVRITVARRNEWGSGDARSDGGRVGLRRREQHASQADARHDDRAHLIRSAGTVDLLDRIEDVTHRWNLLCHISDSISDGLELVCFGAVVEQ